MTGDQLSLIFSPDMCSLPRKHMTLQHISLVICVPLPRKHTLQGNFVPLSRKKKSLVICVPLHKNHTSLVIGVPLARKHKSLKICVALNSKHIITRNYVFEGRGTNITTVLICVPLPRKHISLAICVPLHRKHIITRDMCSPTQETQIPRDMCSPTQEHIFLVICVPYPENMYH